MGGRSEVFRAEVVGSGCWYTPSQLGGAGTFPPTLQGPSRRSVPVGLPDLAKFRFDLAILPSQGPPSSHTKTPKPFKELINTSEAEILDLR